MATTDELNAAFNYIEPRLRQLIALHVPSFFQGQVIANLESPAGRQEVVNDLAGIAAAMEAVRAKDKP